jgi:hypothetical protein
VRGFLFVIVFIHMGKSNSDTIHKILTKFKPEPYIKKIRCGFDTHYDGTMILKCDFTIEKQKLGDRTVNNERLVAHSKELANKIKRETKLPIKHTQTSITYL